MCPISTRCACSAPFGGPVVPDVYERNAGSSASVSAHPASSFAFASSCQNPQAPSEGRSVLQIVSSAGRSSRIASSFGRFAASVTQAFAPESPSRNFSPSSPNSVNSGTVTAPSRQHARCVSSASGVCGSSSPQRSPAESPRAASAFASRPEARHSSPCVQTRRSPSGRRKISPGRSGSAAAQSPQQARARLNRSGRGQRNRARIASQSPPGSTSGRPMSGLRAALGEGRQRVRPGRERLQLRIPRLQQIRVRRRKKVVRDDERHVARARPLAAEPAVRRRMRLDRGEAAGDLPLQPRAPLRPLELLRPAVLLVDQRHALLDDRVAERHLLHRVAPRRAGGGQHALPLGRGVLQPVDDRRGLDQMGAVLGLQHRHAADGVEALQRLEVLARHQDLAALHLAVLKRAPDRDAAREGRQAAPVQNQRHRFLPCMSRAMSRPPRRGASGPFRARPAHDPIGPQTPGGSAMLDKAAPAGSGPARGRLATHEVVNQPEPREALDLWTADAPLRAAVAEAAPGDAEALAAFAASIGSPEARADALAAQRVPPELKAFDRFGRRLDEVAFHPGYHAMMRRGAEAGYAARAFEDAPGGHAAHAATVYLLGQIEPGVCCPLTMTYAAVPALRAEPELAAFWRPKMLARAYDGAAKPAADKTSATFGMAMTEKQGGSDVRANTTRAEPDGDAFRLTGHKWFCSAPMSDAFLTLAYLDEGLTCFLVPRWTPDGERNPIELQRLKDKMGDKANASSEIEYRRAWARQVGEAGRGVPAILEMVHHTRLDAAMAPV